MHASYDCVAEKVGEQIVAKVDAHSRSNATLVVSKEAPVYPMVLNSAGGMKAYLSAVTDAQIMTVGEEGALEAATIADNGEVSADGKTIAFVLAADTPGDSRQDAQVSVGDVVRIDCYEMHTDGAYEINIGADMFSGYFYIEASTLFRDEETGVDMPAEFVIPRAKIQSNFTLTMAASGDPAATTFTIDCMPGYTKFNKTNKVLATLQVIDVTEESHDYSDKGILGHEGRENDDEIAEGESAYYKHSIFDGSESVRP